MAPLYAGNRYAALLSDDESGGDAAPAAPAAAKKKKPNTVRKKGLKRKAAGTQEDGSAKGKGSLKRRRRGAKDTSELEESPHQHQPAEPSSASAGAAPAGPEGEGGGGGGTGSAAGAAAGPASVTPAAAGCKRTLPGNITTEVMRAAEPGARVAAKGDVVKLLYEGRLPGKKDKSFDKGDIDFVLGDGSMVVGFDCGVAGMAVGERRVIFIPSKFGYGKKGKKPKVPPNSDLVFDVILTYAGCDWTDMTRAHANMSVQRREAAKRRGKKPRKS